MIQSIHPQDKVGFLLILTGGVGLQAARVYRAHYDADGQPFPLVMLQFDTERTTGNWVDERVWLTLTADKLDAIRGNPEKFGPAVETICARHVDYLKNPTDAQNGSRTIRCLTQPGFAYGREAIENAVRSSIQRLAKQLRGTSDDPAVILPTLLSSSGGGTGSAVTVLMLRAFMELRFRHFVTQGIGTSLLGPPLVTVSDPYALAQLHVRPHENKILANSFGFRLETDLIERERGTMYIFHQGFANQSGRILDDPEAIARSLGTSVYEMHYCWPILKRRWVDTQDSFALGGGYNADDLPERRIPGDGFTFPPHTP